MRLVFLNICKKQCKKIIDLFVKELDDDDENTTYKYTSTYERTFMPDTYNMFFIIVCCIHSHL